MIALKLVGSFLLIIVFLVVTIYGMQELIDIFMIQKTLKVLFRYYCNVNTMISSYTKILTSFLQNTALIFQIINKTPKEIGESFKIFQSVGQAAESFTSSVECLIPDEYLKSGGL